MTTLADLLEESLTRARALETMCLAHVVLDRACLRGRDRPELSKPGKLVLAYLEQTPAGVPFSWQAVAAHYALFTDKKLGPVLELARDVELLTLHDLSFLSRETVLACLGAVVKPKNTKADRLLELITGGAAA